MFSLFFLTVLCSFLPNQQFSHHFLLSHLKRFLRILSFSSYLLFLNFLFKLGKLFLSFSLSRCIFWSDNLSMKGALKYFLVFPDKILISYLRGYQETNHLIYFLQLLLHFLHFFLHVGFLFFLTNFGERKGNITRNDFVVPEFFHKHFNDSYFMLYKKILLFLETFGKGFEIIIRLSNLWGQSWEEKSMFVELGFLVRDKVEGNGIFVETNIKGIFLFLGRFHCL